MSHLRIFLCHASDDKPPVRELCRRLREDGFEPWLDEERLLPGQDWELEISAAVRASDVVIVCLSLGSVSRVGYVQKELRHVLDVADYQPEGRIFVIPARLEECVIPASLDQWQYVDLFAENGYARLYAALSLRARTEGAESVPIFSARPPDLIRSLKENVRFSSIEPRRRWLWWSTSASVLGAAWMLLQRDTKFRRAKPVSVPPIDLQLGTILNVLGDDLASGIPLLLVEQSFFTALGFRFVEDDPFAAEELYNECFVKLWNYPQMKELIGRLVLLGLVGRPSGPGEYTLTEKGSGALNQLRLEAGAGRQELRAMLFQRISGVIPVLRITETLAPHPFKPMVPVRLQPEVDKAAAQAERVCAAEGFTYQGYLVDGGFIARRKTDAKLFFIDLRAARISEEFEKVLDSVVLNDDSGTYCLRIVVREGLGAVHYSSGNISRLSSDLPANGKVIWRFCLDTRGGPPAVIRRLPFSR